MLKTIIISIIAVAVAMALLAVRIIAKKDGKFSSQHISESKPMRERGISCATSTDRRDRMAQSHKIDVNSL